MSDLTNAELIIRIRDIWEASRQQVIRSVNSAHVCANWLIGRQIVEAEQNGEQRAEYGKNLLKTLSKQLSTEYGNGFSVSALQYMRAFFLAYPALLPIQHAVRVISLESAPTDATWQPGKLHVGLSWTHYRTLLKVERQEARDFYEIETIRNGWSARQLERQIASLLFDRLLKSRDKAGVMALANQGLQPTRPLDVIKDPYVLEFLNLPEATQWHESELEQALLAQLQAELQRELNQFAALPKEETL
ncbi:DUF1016 N-terminal domain-containing protein [Thiofilum flexile]|uniref:DUF1016 N-terminal domain-containing protein n=1 Tax=Thiofilum flexile TaxID=125627 RepID=UPI00036AB2C4|nr:DUF1016 N-terminal domain-containing protein [Thiofilum flexile]